MEQLLRKLKYDYTFDHSKGVHDLIDNQNLNQQYWSFDLTSATDTLPKEVGIAVLTKILRVFHNNQFTRKHSRNTVLCIK